MASLKPQPNREKYLETLRQMAPAERLAKAWELTELSRQLLRNGLQNRNPNLTDDEIQQVFLDRLDACHNKNY